MFLNIKKFFLYLVYFFSIFIAIQRYHIRINPNINPVQFHRIFLFKIKFLMELGMKLN